MSESIGQNNQEITCQYNQLIKGIQNPAVTENPESAGEMEKNTQGNPE